jgi:tetratricopeptide (TPR) repeat protein
MSNLAGLYSAHGRHQDALAMNKKTLELRRRVLPANHPGIAACVNAGACYLAAGDSHQALEIVREALRILQSTLPAVATSHPKGATTYAQV